MKKLSYEISHLDSYDGQHNYELGCYIEEGIIGAVEFVLFDGDMSLTISDIQVRPEYRRKGIGSRMVKVIKDKFGTIYAAPPFYRKHFHYSMKANHL